MGDDGKTQQVHQPVSDLQLNQLRVEWVPYETVIPNGYNPNNMTWHDRMLLRQSLLEDGWTQPIVTLPDGTIVDGEQRWTTAGLDLTPGDIQAVLDKMQKRQAEGAPTSESIMERLAASKQRLEEAVARGERGCLAAITGGLVPITRIDLKDDAHKMIATIRHNRARGTHQVDSMSAIAADLVQLGLDFDDLETRLGMDDDEINRLLDQAAGLQQADALLEETQADFSAAWEPVHLAEITADDELMAALERSREAAAAQKAHEVKLAEQRAAVREQVNERIAAREAEGETITQDDKARIEAEVTASIPQLEKPPTPTLKKFMVFVTVEEYAVLEAALGPDDMANTLLEMCRAKLGEPDSVAA